MSVEIYIALGDSTKKGREVLQELKERLPQAVEKLSRPGVTADKVNCRFLKGSDHPVAVRVFLEPEMWSSVSREILENMLKDEIHYVFPGVWPDQISYLDDDITRPPD